MADNLPPSSADVTESGSLNLPEPSGPHRPVIGMVYPFFPFTGISYVNMKIEDILLASVASNGNSVHDVLIREKWVT
jgi:hypothetical protein